jgi:hypothetical protein
MDFDGINICGTNIPEGFAQQLARWGKRDLVVGIARNPATGQPFALPGLTTEILEATLLECCRHVEAVCNLHFRLAAPGETADIVVTTGQIDGPLGTLAWSQLPGSTNHSGQLQQKYDHSEKWGVSKNPPADMLDLFRVMLHEFLHALGVPHIGEGNLLAPRYSRAISTLQAGDIVELVGRYGPPVTAPPPPPPPPPPPGNDYFYVTVSDRRYRWPVELIG